MRHIDADKLIKTLFPIGLIDDGKYTINAKAVKYAIDNTPTADVVPKSEVAREIFEEIQKIFVNRILHNESQYFEGVLDNITKDLDELKKKYMEGNK